MTKPSQLNFSHRLLDFIASGFYSGHAKVASGTVGTVAALGLIGVLWAFTPGVLSATGGVALALAMTGLGILTANRALELELYGAGNKDPQRIVIDEFAGMLWAIVFIPLTPLNLALAFFFFRLFDTTKPPPARQLEKLPRGWGIVMDDVAAGIMANIVVQLILFGFTSNASAEGLELKQQGLAKGRIVFSYITESGTDLGIIDFEKATLEKFYSSTKLDEYPVWSPDGTKVLFYSDQTGDREIFTLNADGSGLTQLTKSAGYDEDPDWSPDGTQIVFHSARLGKGQNLFIMNADGTKPRAITNDRFKNTTPRWSPRGNEILYSTTSSWPGWDLALYDLGTKTAAQLTGGFKTYCRAGWHPDGGRFAFSYGFGNEIDIYLQEKGGAPKQLTKLTGREYDAIFADGGKKLFFVSEATAGAGNFQLFMLDMESLATTQITEGAGSVRHPSWSPLPAPPAGYFGKEVEKQRKQNSSTSK